MSKHTIVLRDASVADAPFLEALFVALHRDEFLPLGLPDAQLHALVSMQARAQRLGYARDFPEARDWIVLDPEAARATASSAEAVGRLLTAVLPSELRLVDVALLPEAQGRGLGTALLEDLKEQARRLRLPLRLAVRPGNRAFHLYQRLGFSIMPDGGQPGFELLMEWLPDASVAIAHPAADALTAPGGAAPSGQLGRFWHGQVGSRFMVEAPEAGASVELSLRGLEWNGPEFGKRFSLLLTGPLMPVLPQRLYRLRSQTNQMDEELFLVPIGPNGDVMRYEAVFNS